MKRSDEPRFLGAAPEPSAPVTVPADWMIMASHPLLVMSFPRSWKPYSDDGRPWWQLDNAEVFLHVFGFERQVPPLDVFLASQHRTIAANETSNIEDDRPLVHPRGPAHLLQWRALEPSLQAYAFTACYLRTGKAILVLKLDQPVRGALRHVDTLLSVFATILPR